MTSLLPLRALIPAMAVLAVGISAGAVMSDQTADVRAQARAPQAKIGGATAASRPRLNPKPQPSATATVTVEPTATPDPTTSAAPEPAPTLPVPTEPAPVPDLCASTWTVVSGLPWRGTQCQTAGYANHVIPDAPVLHPAETAKLRTLPGAMLNIDEYSEPIYTASPTAPMRSVRCTTYACIGGTTAPVVGDEQVAPGTDGQLIIVDPVRRKTYEFWAAGRDADGSITVNSDGSVSASAMNVVDLDGPGNKTVDGKNLNITGAGVSRMFGVVRANEVRAAATRPATAIQHALQVSLPTSFNCVKTFREPATKTDGRSTASDCMVEGGRYQMDPSFDCSSVTVKLGQAVCYAMQKYGAYDMDNNGSRSLVVYGQQRRSWSTADADYAAAGIRGDYSGLGIPMSKMRALARWTGQ